MIAADCRVTVDGRRLADSNADPLDAPAALSGLTVTWGRSTTVDQPSPSSCAFTVYDPAGGAGFLELLRTGRRVEVTATATTYPDPTHSLLTDPSFEATPIGSAPAWSFSNAAAAVTARYAASGRRSLAVVALDPSAAVTITIPPAPYSPDPTAWDEVPRVAPSSTWSYGLSVRPPAGAAWQVRPVLFTAPSSTAWSPAGPWLDVTDPAPAGDGWLVIDAPLVGGPSSGWLGLQARAYPTGAAWLDTPGRWTEQATRWVDAATAYLDDVELLAPIGGIPSTVLVFSGRISDLEATYDAARRAVLVDVTAVNVGAELANRDIGDEPWPAEPLAIRVDRIVDLTGLPVTARVDAGIADLVVSWRDVDRQPAGTLLANLATSAGAVAWPATHLVTGPQLWLEDMDARAAGAALEVGDDDLVHVVPVAVPGAAHLSACDVDLDPVQWRQDVADVATRVAVSWKEQTVNSDGNPQPTDRTVTVVDDALEDPVAGYGTRRVQISTELTSAADAVELAERTLGRLYVDEWRISGLAWRLEQTRDPDPAAALRMLDGTRRHGAPIQIADLPAWNPTGRDLVTVFAEGGTYTYTGGWTLALVVSSSTGQGRAAMPWHALTPPAWRWIDIGREVTWSSLRGVTAAPTERLAA